MSLRRVLALALLAPLLGPYAASYSALASAAGHCSRGVCHCAHDRHSVPKAPASCHGPRAASASDCFIKARCNHEAPVLPGTYPVGLIAAKEGPSPDLPPVPIATGIVHAPRAGFSRIDPLPPRLI